MTTDERRTCSRSTSTDADAERRAARRRPRRADRDARSSCRRSGSTTPAAASCSSRSPGCPSTTRPAPSGRCWQRSVDDIARLVRRRDPGRAGLRLVGEDPAAAGRVRAAPARCAATCRWTSASRRCGRRWTRCAADYPGLAVHGVVGDFTRHLDRLPARGGRRMVAFLGGTIGNLLPAERAAFLAAAARRCCEPGEWLLLGTDLVNDPSGAGAGLRRRRRGDRRVQPQRAAGAQPRAGRRLRRRRVRARRGLGRRAGVDRDAAARRAGHAGAGRRARPDRGLRRGGGDAHRDLGEVPDREGAARCCRRPGSRSPGSGPTRTTASPSPWPPPSERLPPVGVQLALDARAGNRRLQSTHVQTVRPRSIPTVQVSRARAGVVRHRSAAVAAEPLGRRPPDVTGWRPWPPPSAPS